MATWIWVIIGPGNRLLPNGAEPLPVKILTDFSKGCLLLLFVLNVIYCNRVLFIQALKRCVTTVTSHWGRWRLKSPASRLFTQPFIQAQIKENIKTPCHWTLCREFTDDRWIPAHMASNAENVFIWWRHHVLKWYSCPFCETLSALLIICDGIPVVMGELSSPPRASNASFGDFFVVNLHTLLNEKFSCRWFETPWRSCDIITMRVENPTSRDKVWKIYHIVNRKERLDWVPQVMLRLEMLQGTVVVYHSFLHSRQTVISHLFGRYLTTGRGFRRIDGFSIFDKVISDITTHALNERRLDITWGHFY